MLTLSNVKKSFDSREIIKGVSLQIERGESFGLLGPNGAGKSTLISMICGLIPYGAGEIRIDGKVVGKQLKEIKQIIGVVPQDIALYPSMSAMDNLLFWGKMYGLSGKAAKIRAQEVLEIVGLADRAKGRIETFSGGMKRRINIGAALMHRPQLLIMDEPTVGIDPQSRNHILETVKSLNEQGMTVIYTSHYMEEVEYLCKRIAIIDEGKLIASGTKKDLSNRLAGGTVLKLTVDSLHPLFIEELKTLNSVEKVIVKPGEEIDVHLHSKMEMVAEVILLASRSGIHIHNMQLQEANLETLFLQLTGRTLRE
ncbi:putative ABC transporter ATP-binding protein YfiL [Sporosarcina luteola]|uniref:Putative ABC transporter ATP-binding protein YfiL n=1 Tax=Sporosarcina luteola TaxID=582850 RepID=A0A511ZBY1_9BACL|nr:ABC transporter ATP-binding protein [Sporosarcina luteola]GEN84956.1 putative ABC transporter ATP-binding protein YfiL [Sporosarcina luteola]